MKETNINDFLADGIKDEVIDMKNPTCQNCNECCSMGTMLLAEEYKALKKYLNTQEGHRIYKEAVNRIKKNTKPGTIYWMCPFSSSGRKCLIYNKRPSICREFHCSPALMSINFNKDKYTEKEHYLIYHLFYKKKEGNING